MHKISAQRNNTLTSQNEDHILSQQLVTEQDQEEESPDQYLLSKIQSLQLDLEAAK